MDKREKELLTKMFLIGGEYALVWGIIALYLLICFLSRGDFPVLLCSFLGVLFVFWFFERKFKISRFRYEEKPDSSYSHSVWLQNKLRRAEKSILIVSPKLNAIVFDGRFCRLLSAALDKNKDLIIEIIAGPIYQTINWKNHLMKESSSLAREFGERFLIRFIDPAPKRDLYVVDEAHFLLVCGGGEISAGDFSPFSALLLEYKVRKELRIKKPAVAAPHADEMCWSELR